MPGRSAAMLARTDSLCPAPEEQLLEAVLGNRVERVHAVAGGRPALLAHVYPGPGRPALLMACAEPTVEAQTARALLRLGADPLARDPDNENWEALHFAAACADGDKLRAVLDYLPPGHVDDTAGGSNALHVLLTYGEEACRERVDAGEDNGVVDNGDGELLRCARLLIDAGIDLNAGDANNVSPVLWAAKKGRVDVVAALLDNGVRPVDIDTHTSRGKTARQLITERQLYGRPLPPPLPVGGPGDGAADQLELMFAFLRRGQETAFLNCPEAAVRACADGESARHDATLLQFCCQGGLRRAAEHLLRCGADPNRTARQNPRSPVELAAEGGRRPLLRLLLADHRVRVPPAVLAYLASKQRPGDEAKAEAGGDDGDGQHADAPFDYVGCYAELMEAVRRRGAALLDVNGVDERTNTPLHYAARYAGPRATLRLLEAGASLAARNRFGVMPVEDVDAAVLERHLDDCIKFELDSKKFDKEDFTVTVNYSTLLPPPRRAPSQAVTVATSALADGADAECVSANDDRYEYVEEMEVIYYMSRAVEFKHLLKHPVIVSFLFMKWHRIRWLFYVNLLFYMVFVLSMVTYIFTSYAGFGGDVDGGERSRMTVVVAFASYAILWLAYVLLVARELFQLVASVDRYLTNLENYMEVTLVVITGCILTDNPPTDDARRQLSALAILLAAFELVLMLGQHPLLSTNVVMLRTVSYNFFKFLLWYSLLIVAFSMSFYLLFAEPPPTAGGPVTDGDGAEEDFFESPGKSVFKTIVMLTGEFDASGLNFRTHPVLSKLIFVLFVFMIAIILLNLLTGLAVSDTQMIRSDAELVGHAARAAHVRHVEALLVGEWAAGEWAALRALRRLWCCCCPSPGAVVNPSVWRSLRPLAGRACVFPDPVDRRLTVHPNRGGQVDVPSAPPRHRTGKPGSPRGGCRGACVGPVRLDRDTVRRTVAIIQAKRERRRAAAPAAPAAATAGLVERVAALHHRQADLAAKLDEISRKLDRIVTPDHGRISAAL